jgi:hypothetical protein
VRLPTDYFKRLFEEACPNHAYPIWHKLKDCGMMRSFMTLRSLALGAELDEGLDGSDTTPFPKENAVMTIYEGPPPPDREGIACLTQAPRLQLIVVGDTGALRFNGTGFSHIL